MRYYNDIPDDVLDKYYGKTSPYINPYNEYNDITYEDEYDYFEESTDDDIRKGVL